MKKPKEKYILRINNEGIEVTKTIYDEYYRLMNREIYLINRDKKLAIRIEKIHSKVRFYTIQIRYSPIVIGSS